MLDAARQMMDEEAMAAAWAARNEDAQILGVFDVANKTDAAIDPPPVRSGDPDVLKSPFHLEIRADLRHEKLSRRSRVCRISINWAEFLNVTERTEFTVMIFLENKRVSIAVPENPGCGVPPKRKCAQKLPVGVEVHQMSLCVVIAGIYAKENRTVRRNGGSCGRIVQNASGRTVVRLRINALVGS